LVKEESYFKTTQLFHTNPTLTIEEILKNINIINTNINKSNHYNNPHSNHPISPPPQKASNQLPNSLRNNKITIHLTHGLKKQINYIVRKENNNFNRKLEMLMESIQE
jgi:hypothetical protein